MSRRVCSSIAFAKKSIVVGDIYQIPPVYSLTPYAETDNGKLIFGEEYKPLIKEDLLKRGQLVTAGSQNSGGSLMKIARSVSAFHEGTIEYSKQEGELKNAGMMLKEHRRCYDKIVRYCNDLIYDGALVPKTGNPTKSHPFKEFQYAHIVGKSSKINGSRRNCRS